MKKTLIKALMLITLFSCTKSGIELKSSNENNATSLAPYAKINTVCFIQPLGVYKVTAQYFHCTNDSVTLDYRVGDSIISSVNIIQSGAWTDSVSISTASKIGNVYIDIWGAKRELFSTDSLVYGNQCNNQ